MGLAGAGFQHSTAYLFTSVAEARFLASAIEALCSWCREDLISPLKKFLLRRRLGLEVPSIYSNDRVTVYISAHPHVLLSRDYSYLTHMRPCCPTNLKLCTPNAATSRQGSLLPAQR